MRIFHLQISSHLFLCRIVNFASTSPRGMEKSGVTSEGGGLYSAEFNWVPSPKLVGTVETFCYSPFDSER